LRGELRPNHTSHDAVFAVKSERARPAIWPLNRRAIVALIDALLPARQNECARQLARFSDGVSAPLVDHAPQ
jgi:hypothetical protein